MIRVSQHFFDPYSFCHILHGFIFYGLWGWWPELVWGRAWWWVWLAGAGLAVLAELCHEIIENSEWVIQLYRSNSGTSSQYEVPTLPRLYITMLLQPFSRESFLPWHWHINKLSPPITTIYLLLRQWRQLVSGPKGGQPGRQSERPQ